MALIKFIGKTGSTVYINPNNVSGLTPAQQDGMTDIWLNGISTPVTVQGDPDQVAEKLYG
jgi:hypothetical protein